MYPMKNDNATHIFKSPDDFDELEHGKCGNLEVEVLPNKVYRSFWQFDAKEWDMLCEGKGVVCVEIIGGQPPIRLYVSEPPRNE